MPGMHDGFGGADHFHGGFWWAPLLFMATTLFLVTAPVALTAGYLWWRSRRARRASGPMEQPLLADEPSSFELLRRRYVVGEIDAPLFEEMTERLLVSEEAERRRPPMLARYDQGGHYDRYLGRERHAVDQRITPL